MSINISCNINKNEVILEVSKITGYTGKNAKEEGVFGLIAATEDESSMLDTFWNDSIAYLFDSVKKYNSTILEDSDGVNISFELPSSFDKNLAKSIQKTLSFFVVNWMCSKWFNLSKKDEVSYYVKECERLLINISRLMNTRNKPIKK